MSFNRIIDLSLLQIENFIGNIPALLYFVVFLMWIFIVWKSKLPYQVSLKISAFLIVLSTIVLVFTLTTVAVTAGQYAFLFLGIGIIQLLFAKDSQD